VSSSRSRTDAAPLLLATFLCAGCSATFLTPPPAAIAPGRPRPQVECTTSYLLPILDSALAAYELAGVGYVATLDDSRFERYPISRQTDMALGAAFAAAFAGSAVYGFVTAARCRRIHEGPRPDGYVPGYSEAPVPGDAPFSRHGGGARRAASRSWGLQSAPGGSEMVRRPDPKGAAWKRLLNHEETGPASPRPQPVE